MSYNWFMGAYCPRDKGLHDGTKFCNLREKDRERYWERSRKIKPWAGIKDFGFLVRKIYGIYLNAAGGVKCGVLDSLTH